MSLSPGVRLGPYEILAALGVGGMGEVYRARDPRLNRDVAIKILPELFAADPDRVARFQREAQVLASLNHPNIAYIHGLEEIPSTSPGQVGAKALVLELVDGPSLSDLIARGPLPLDEALRIARQIADALEAAHENGIVHRDLKPANVKLTSSGTVKVLDFGLAKPPSTSDSGMAPNLSMSPTLTSPAVNTHAGIILGTAAYMSPEQARGKVVDRRSDVWAYGCVLYEMLTGRRAFGGDDLTLTLAAIVKDEPDWNALPATTPPAIRRLLRRTLTKESTERSSDLSSARLEIKDALAPAEQQETRPAVSSRSSSRLWPTIAAALALVTVALAGIVLWGRLWGREPAPSAMWLAMPPVRDGFAMLKPTVSPDGRKVAFLAPSPNGVRTLWVRSLENPVAQEIRGAEDAVAVFWHPNSQSLAFFAQEKLKRVDLASPSVQVLADAPSGRGGTWNRNGVIVFAPASGDALYRVAESGGEPTKITELDTARGEQEHLFPYFLPDDRTFLYLSRKPDERESRIMAASLGSHEVRPVLASRSRAEYAGGYLFFGRDDGLFAQAFDAATLTLSGEPRRITDGVGMGFGNMANYAFSVSPARTLATWGGWMPVTRLTIVDRAGRFVRQVGGDEVERIGVTVSPDERWIATEVRNPRQNTVDVWLYDMKGSAGSRFTSGDRTWTGSPAWAPDSTRVLFNEFATEYHVKSVRGGETERWAHGIKSRRGFPRQWSAGTEYIVTIVNDPETLWDIWLLPVSGERKPERYLASRYIEWMPSISPDGKWIAYASNESGPSEVYINTFPRASTPQRISLSGGTHPLWRRDGPRAVLHFGGSTVDGRQPERPGLRHHHSGTSPAFLYGARRLQQRE